MGKHDDIAYLDATALAELVRRKKVKPIELVDAAIERIEKLNPKLNAVVTPMFDQAREAARKKLPDGPFKGVPFLIKDLLAECAGARYTEATAFTGDYISENDTELVARHKRAGLIIIGKTNTPEFGIMPTTEPKRFGPSRNPWNVNHSTGGSSGGSGAAVASRMVPMAHGNDGGGSIRIPASCCGIFGLKPTRGRNSLAPKFGDLMGGLIAEHGLSISVRDSAALLDATSGPVPGDPYYAPPPRKSFVRQVTKHPGKLRIGYTVTAATGAKVHEDNVNAVLETVKLLKKLGHKVREENFDVDGEKVTQAFVTAWFAGFAWQVDGWAKKLGKQPAPEFFEPATWAIQEAGRNFKASDYLLAVQNLQLISRQIAEMFDKYDVFLTPTLAEPPPPIGYFDSPPEAPLLGFMKAAGYVPFTPICNITGQPAMSVPLYWNKDDLPIGSHFIGRYGDEATLFRLAAQLEKAKPWAAKRPPISA